jgi:hypothetical protein
MQRQQIRQICSRGIGQGGVASSGEGKQLRDVATGDATRSSGFRLTRLASALRASALGAYYQVFGANSQVRARQASYIPFSHNHQQRGWRSILPERFTELRIDGHIMEVKQWYEALSL